jgi:predicted PurR-regulated permease PerM
VRGSNQFVYVITYVILIFLIGSLFFLLRYWVASALRWRCQSAFRLICCSHAAFAPVGVVLVPSLVDQLDAMSRYCITLLLNRPFRACRLLNQGLRYADALLVVPVYQVSL